MIASLPMYDADRPAVEALWEGIARRLRRDGIDGVPASLTWPQDLHSHWLDNELLLSQTCGYPLTHALLHRVQLIGAFRYSAPGCEDACYSSTLVVRAGDGHLSLQDFAGRRLATNSLDSQSGYHCLRPLAAAHGRTVDSFFRSTAVSGSHRLSIEMVRANQADIAAIDCVTLAGLQRADRHLLDGLAVLDYTPPTPGLPLITSLAASPASMRALKRALHAMVRDDALAEAREALFIDGFEELPWSAYLPYAAT